MTGESDVPASRGRPDRNNAYETSKRGSNEMIEQFFRPCSRGVYGHNLHKRSDLMGGMRGLIVR